MSTLVPLLEVSGLSVTFHQYTRGLHRRTVTPVVDISLRAYAAEVLVVVGASGAGKSLVGLAVFGLLPANAEQHGTIAYKGRALSPAVRKELTARDIALLPQSPTFLNPVQRVGTQLTRVARLAGAGDPRDLTRSLLERYRLPPETARLYPHQLSGGMARRVLFAMATMARPSVVFVDEPTPGLDPETARDVLTDLRRLADEGSAIVLVSHDIDQALTIADRVVICHAGRTIEEALPVQFRGDGSALSQPYSRALWNALPRNGFVPTPDTPTWEEDPA